MKMIGEKLFQLSKSDVVKGFVMSILASLITAVYTMLNAGTIPTDLQSWKPTLITAVGAGVAYLIKNFFSNADGQFLKKDEVKK